MLKWGVPANKSVTILEDSTTEKIVILKPLKVNLLVVFNYLPVSTPKKLREADELLGSSLCLLGQLGETSYKSKHICRNELNN